MENNNSPNKQISLQNAQNFMNYQVPSFMQNNTGQGGAGGFGQNLLGGGGGGNVMSNLSQAQGNMRYNVPNLAGGDGAAGGGGIGGFLGKASSFLGSAATPIGIGLSIVGSVIGAKSARKAQRKAEKQAKKAKKALDRRMKDFQSMDTSNPYLNMENVMEDLTIDQRASQFQKEQFQQSQANILDNLRGAAGGSGVAALAQTLAREGQLASQQSAIDIGKQERANQMAERSETARLKGLEIQGEYQQRQDEQYKTETLLGMAQQQYAAKQGQVEQAKQARMDAITGGIQNAAGMFAGFGG
tara:strand:- start:14024 stop:14923 length:900 start_codon:yes stop_codon:yes gene_type:complete